MTGRDAGARGAASRSPGNARREAARVLTGILRDQGSLSSLLPSGQGSDDGALVRELCYGVCRHYFALHHLLDGMMKKPLKNKDMDIHCLLLAGLYQLFYLRVPDHAAINETVAAVPRRKAWARGLINGVLREASRRHEDLNTADLASVLPDDPVIRYSHPQWLVQALRRDWPQDWEAILRANNARAPMTLRVNQRLTSRADYLAALTQAGIEADPGPLAPTAVRLAAPLAVERLSGFERGLASVQDEASQLVPGLLDLAPGQRVLDACAAPGGKSCAMLEREPTLRLLALDNEERRLGRIRDNLGRLGLQAPVVAGDAADPAHWWDGEPFDRILLDVPCSATGVIRRHPDVKLLRRPEQVDELSRRQRDILAGAWRTLKSGGLLLYTTCSVLQAENSRVISAFIEETADARHLAIDADWGHACPHGRQLLPGEADQDGFYYALLQKC